MRNESEQLGVDWKSIVKLKMLLPGFWAMLYVVTGIRGAHVFDRIVLILCGVLLRAYPPCSLQMAVLSWVEAPIACVYGAVHLL